MEKAIKYAPDQLDKYRIQALVDLFYEDLENGLDSINKALAEKEDDHKSILINAYLLIKVGKNEGALGIYNLYPQKNDSKWWSHKADLELLSGKTDDSLKSLKEAIKLDNNNYMAYKIMSDIKITYFEMKIKSSGLLSSKEIFELNNLRTDILDRRIEILKGKELFDELAEAYIIRGTAYMQIDDYKNAANDFRSALDINPGNIVILKNLILLCIWENDIANGEQYIKLLKNNISVDLGSKIIIAEFLISAGRPDEAIAELRKLIEKGIEKNKEIEIKKQLIIAYLNNLNTNEAFKILEDIKSSYTNEETIIIEATYLMKIGKNDEAISILENNLNSLPSLTKYQAKELLANLYFKKNTKHSLQLALHIYEEISSILIINDFLKRLIFLQYKFGKYKECIETCRKIRESHGDIEFFIDFESSILFNSQNFQAASILLKLLCQRNPSNIDYKIRYVYCIKNIGKLDEVNDVLQQVENIAGENPQNLVILSDAFLALKNYEKSIHYLFKALELQPDNHNLHLKYINFMNEHNKNISNKTINKKYFDKYGDCLINYEKRFPNFNYVKSFQIEEDIDKLKSKLLNIFLPYNKHEIEIKELYQKKQFPICSVCEVLNRDLFLLWSNLIRDSSTRIWAHNPNEEVIDKEFFENNNNIEEIIIDPIALFTIFHLNLEDKLLKLFNKITINQILFTFIDNKRNEYRSRLNKDNEYLQIYEDDIIISKISKEQITQELQLLDRIYSFLTKENKVSKIGKSINRLNKKEEQEETLERLFGMETMECIIEGFIQKKPIFSVEWSIRVICKTNFNINSFGISSFIHGLLAKKLITENEYNKLLITLIDCNYDAIIVREDTLLYAIEDSNYQMKGSAKKLFDSLRLYYYDSINLVEMSVNFLRKLWISQTLVQTKQIWTRYFLNSLALNENRRKIKIKGIIKCNAKIIIPDMISFLRKDFFKAIDQWEKEQFILY